MLRSALATLTLLTLPFAAFAQDSATPSRARRERVTRVVDSIARDAIGRQVLAGMVVIATRGPDTLLAGAYGSAEPENDVRMTVAHVFQLASVTKQFTAAAVLTLVQDGRVGLDEPIRRRDLTIFAGRYDSDVTITPVEGGTGTLRLERGPLPPAELSYAGRSGSGWIFTDGRARYTFEPPVQGSSSSPAVWADLVVSLVRWERAP
jgi:hypothetical protein